MENASYVGLAYQAALERKMTLVSNNIANMDTTGYKASHARFKEFMTDTDPGQPLAMVEDGAEYKDFTPGSLTSTGNAMDIALSGKGFLGVKAADGQEYLTRNGRLQINSLNQIVTSSGEMVMGSGGQPITVPEGEHSVTITQDGVVSSKDGAIGELKIVAPADPQTLHEVGNSLFKSDGKDAKDTTTHVQQGYLEGSNVNPIVEMTSMMDVQRAYETMARMLQNDSDRQRDTIRKLSDTH